MPNATTAVTWLQMMGIKLHNRVLLVSSLRITDGSTINHCCVGTAEYVIIPQSLTIVETFVVDE